MPRFNLPLRELQPINLDTNALENIRRFREEFLTICSISGLDKSDNDTRLHYFYKTVGRAACSIIENTILKTIPVQDKQNLEVIITLLEEYYTPLTRTNLSERLQFRRISQNFGENFEAYVARIRHQATKCQCGSDADEIMRDQFIAGLWSDDLRNYIASRKDGTATCEEVCNLAKLWSAENEVLLHPRTPVPVEVYTSLQSTQASIRALYIRGEPPQDDPKVLEIPVPIKEEKWFSYPSSVLPPPTTPPPAQSSQTPSMLKSLLLSIQPPQLPQPRLATSLPVQMHTSTKSMQAPILALNIGTEPSPDDPELLNMPMLKPIKEEKCFLYSSSVLSPPNTLEQSSQPSSPEPSLPLPPYPQLSALPPATPVPVRICASPESKEVPVPVSDGREELQVQMPITTKEKELLSNSTPALPPPSILSPMQLSPSTQSTSSTQSSPSTQSSSPSLPPTQTSALPPTKKSWTAATMKYALGTFIAMKKDLRNSNPVIWRVDSYTLLEKFLPSGYGNVFRSQGMFRNWDPAISNEYEQLQNQFAKKEMVGNKEITIVELNRKYFKSPPNKRRKKNSKE